MQILHHRNLLCFSYHGFITALLSLSWMEYLPQDFKILEVNHIQRWVTKNIVVYVTYLYPTGKFPAYISGVLILSAIGSMNPFMRSASIWTAWRNLSDLKMGPKSSLTCNYLLVTTLRWYHGEHMDCSVPCSIWQNIWKVKKPSVADGGWPKS